jgi:hypothetical protein
MTWYEKFYVWLFPNRCTHSYTVLDWGILIIPFVLLLLYLFRAVVPHARMYLRYVFSKVLYCTGKALHIKSDTVVDAIRAIPLPKEINLQQHTHGQSAGQRTRAVTWIGTVAEALGLPVYSYQQSAADQRRGRAGLRTYYWGKDLSAKPTFTSISNHVVMLIDVDYYVDMNYLLSRQATPVMIYTCTPTAASRSTGEYAYYFLSDGKMEYTLSGGAKYQHHLWDYASDTILAYSLFPWPRCVSYRVERRSVDDDHSVLALIPVAQWVGPSVFLARLLLFDPLLKRFNPVVGDYVRLYVQDKKEGVLAVTGRVSEYISASIGAANDSGIREARASSSVPLNLYKVRTIANFPKGVEENAASSLLANFHNQQVQWTPPRVYPVKHSIVTYQYSAPNFSDAKAGMEPYMSQICPGAYVPIRSIENEAEAVDGRIEKVKSNATLSGKGLSYAKEFITHLAAGKKHTLTSQTFDEVWEKQPRPTQRRTLLDSLCFWRSPKRVVSFLKAEPYLGPKSPRVISTVDPKFKVEYSKDMYALSEHVKQFDWYAFGKTPREVALRVADICTKASNVVMSDFSRFDGHVSPALRAMENMVIMNLFRKDICDEVATRHNKQFKSRGYTPAGVKYDTGTTRLSGSPETSVMNTICSAYIAYTALREAEFTENEAWDNLGIYGGDDGFTPNITPQVFIKVSKWVGQVAKSEGVTRGSLGVTFLARFYGPHVWNGDPDSICDLVRQITKFHLTCRLPSNVSPVEKFLEKARSYYLTDQHTPVIGEFVSRAIDLHGQIPEATESTAPMRRWQSDVSFENQYPNTGNVVHWAGKYVEDLVERTQMDLGLFHDHIKSSRTVEQLMHVPVVAPLMEEKHHAVSVNGQIPDPPQVDGSNSETVKRPRRRRRKRKKKQWVPTGNMSRSATGGQPIH